MLGLTENTNPVLNPLQQHKGVYISTYGCQMNVNDTERMYSLLEMLNFTPVNSAEEAELIIVNSCSVREKPVHKVHSEVGRYRPLKLKNPNLKIGVGGCVAQQEKTKLLLDVPLLDFVFGPDNIDDLPGLVSDVYEKNQKLVRAKFEHGKPYQIQTLIRNAGVSTFVNITKGCDNFCTFCVVPFTRGRERSRTMVEILEDIRNLVKRGAKEVTLLGQNVNSYTSDCGANFSRLLQAVAEDTDIERIRYTTSHPKDFDQELCDVMQKYRAKICDYIHLPVQAGSSEVLARMNRGYTREEYLEKVKMIREAIPGVTLSTDIIVGFPGETHEQYLETLSLLHEVQYESVFAFQYSPRPLTKAAKFTDQVSEKEKNQRLVRLFAEQNKIAFKKCEDYLGKTLDVLVEKNNDAQTGSDNLSGRSTQNKIVHFAGRSELVGQTVQVKIVEAFPQTMYGELL